MTDAEDSVPGAPSLEAVSLYARLAREGPVPVGDGPDEVPPDDPAAAELIESKVARLALVAVSADGLAAPKPEILRLLALGKTDAAIAAERGQSVRTVRRHISEMMAELEAKSRFAAGVAAVRRGWL